MAIWVTGQHSYSVGASVGGCWWGIDGIGQDRLGSCWGRDGAREEKMRKASCAWAEIPRLRPRVLNAPVHFRHA
jgi:hypothetical protein